MGQLTYNGSGKSATILTAWLSQPIDATITTLPTVILTPQPALLDRDPLVTEVWGDPVTITATPLRRFDLKRTPPTPGDNPTH